MSDLPLPIQQPEIPEFPSDDFDPTQDAPDQMERFAASWRRRTVETDMFDYTERLSNRETWTLYDGLPEDARERATLGGFQQHMKFLRPDKARALLFEEYENLGIADVPKTEADFLQGITEARRAEWMEAERILDIDGPGIGGFAGELARDIVDPINLALAPLGVGGSILRVAAAETVIGGVAAGAGLPREFAVADELGTPEPNVFARILTEAGASGILGGGIVALVRGAQAYRARGEAKQAGAPPDMSTGLHEAAQGEAEEGLAGTRPPLERPAQTADAEETWEPPDFDYSPRGNASPVTNRVGYVYGKMLELGLEPHIAAGYTANFMAESGATMNPRAIGDGGNAYGIAQWNDRRHALFRFAEGRGTSWDDLDTQIAFWYHEIHTSEAGAHARIVQARTAEEAAQLVSDLYERPGIPHMNTRVGYARTLMNQYNSGKVPKGQPSAEVDYTPTGTARGYTVPGQVRTASGTRIDVEYEVVDASVLTRASGDLQPRDRSLAMSDAQIAAMAADLDPALLTPAPTADRGAPIVGPDNIVESGNARFSAIERAYDRYPDRVDAYRQQIEAMGFDIPAEVERPVLIGRRTSALDDAERVQFAIDAQDSGIARMTPVERAQAEAQMIDAEALARLNPGKSLDDPANADFVRRALDRLPASEQNAFIGPDGRLNRDGAQAIARALFARAWDSEPLVRRFNEADAGDLRSLLDALFEAAPEWARLRAEIDAGTVKPEFDVTAHVLDGVHIIAKAREGAKAGTPTGEVLKELLDTPDLIEGAVSPLTRSLIEFFWRGGRATPKGEIARFLGRYAAEARKVGGVDEPLLDAPDLIDVLRGTEPKAFKDLNEVGPSRFYDQPRPRVDPEQMPEDALNDGAMSEEAIEADAELAEELEGALTGPLRNSPSNEVANLKRALDAEAEDVLADGDFDVPVGDGETIRASELLDDVQEDMDLDLVVDLCVRKDGN